MSYVQQHDRTVTVYGFRQFDLDRCELQWVARKATPEVIAGLPGAELLPGTAEQVPVDALDAEGYFRRVATGWGDLD